MTRSRGRAGLARIVIVIAIAACYAGALACPCSADDGEAEQAVEELSRCVVLLENDTNNKYITGTLLRQTDPCVITNYHILASTADTVAVFINGDDGTVERFSCDFIKGDPALDMALFRVSFKGKKPSAFPSTNTCLSFDRYAAPSAIRRGREVLFLGFPLHYGISGNGSDKRLLKQPVCRRGMIASVVTDGEFLVDAMVNNGNSGSPVFVLVPGGRGRPAHYLFAGIIKEFQHDRIPCRINGRDVEIPHNAGLGIVIPAAIVRQFVDGN